MLAVFGGWASFCGAPTPGEVEAETLNTTSGATRASSGETSSAQSLPARPSRAEPCAAESSQGGSDSQRPQENPHLFDHAFVVPSLAQLASVAETVKIEVFYQKGRAEARAWVDLKEVVSSGQEPLSLVWMTHEAPEAIDWYGGDRDKEGKLSCKALDRTSLSAFLRTLGEAMQPRCDSWIVRDDQGNIVSADPAFGLQCKNLSKHLRKHWQLDRIQRLFLEGADFHGLDTWYFPHLTYAGLGGLLPFEDYSLSPIPPLCLARAHVLAKDVPGQLRLLCLTPVGLPYALTPYLRGAVPKIKFIFSRMFVWPMPFFVSIAGFLGQDDVPSQQDTVDERAQAYVRRGRQAPPLILSWRVATGEGRLEAAQDNPALVSQKDSQPEIKERMKVFADGSLGCVTHEEEAEEETVAVLSPELVAHVLSFLRFWEDRFSLISIVPQLADHVWRMGFELPVSHFLYCIGGGKLFEPCDAIRSEGMWAYVPGPYQMPTRAFLDGVRGGQGLVSTLSSFQVTRLVTCEANNPEAGSLDSFHVGYVFPGNRMLVAGPIPFQPLKEYDALDIYKKLDTMIFQQLSQLFQDHQQRLLKEKKAPQSEEDPPL
ncbi:hypothetical protein EIL50_00975 [bacterium NHP-B]|nr:hypothetical protein EIL50_00975 [bacterium NHP-B]